MTALIANQVGPLDAYGIVNEQIQYFRDQNDYWVSQATITLGTLSSLDVEPISFSVDYNVDTFLPAFNKPTAPTPPTTAPITPNLPSTPTLDPVSIRVLGDAPTEPDFSGLTYVQPTPPNQAQPSPPTNVDVVLDPIDLVTRPTYTLPTLAELRAIVLPTVPVITIPAFIGVRPTFDIAMPDDGALAWTEEAYVSPIRAQMLVALDSMIQGGLGLPVAVEQAIFDRGRAREDRVSRKQIMEVTEDMAARGLTEPNGILANRLLQAREANRDAAHGLNRDLTIATTQMAVDGMKFAITQGMALEQTLIQLNTAINERALKAALATRDYAIQRVNAAISYQNLQQQAYSIDAQVWKQQIDAELTKLDVLRAQIEEQRLVGDANKDLIAQFEAQWRGVQAMATFYATDVEAAKTKAEINTQRIDAAKLRVEVFSAEVDAWSKGWDGYKSQVDAALGTTRFAESLASIYSSRLNGYKTKGDAYFQEGRFQIERNGQTLELFKAELQGAEQDLRGQLAQLDSQLRTFEANTRLYEAEGTIAQAESAAIDRTTNLLIENERNRTSVALQQAQIRISQMEKLAELLLEQIKTKAGVIAQIVAGTTSGMHVGASLSGSVSQGYSHSEGFSYSGGTTDKDPNF